MSAKNNFLSLYRREGYNQVPVGFILCPALEAEFKKRYPQAKSYQDHFNFPYRIVSDPGFAWNFDNLDMIPDRKNIDWHKYYPEGFKYDVKFDGWGVAHETSPNSMHMTKMHHPLKNARRLKNLKTIPGRITLRLIFHLLRNKSERFMKKIWRYLSGTSAPSGRLPGTYGAWKT